MAAVLLMMVFSILLIFSLLSSFSLAFDVSTLSFDDAYSPLFGDGNLVRSDDGKTVRLLLNRYTGSGFRSSDYYDHGFFSASIKLPSDYTAGIVVAFYTSNGNVFQKSHDELDFEFLGNVKGTPWRVQTNVYGNGSTSRGREERYHMWFDPSREFHRYSILWTCNIIIFYIDDIPIREVVRNDAMGGDYPSKPMTLYATIWDGSSWATSGGRYKADYQYAPFVSEFTNLALEGCAVDPIQQVPSAAARCLGANVTNADYAIVTPAKRLAMRKFRETYMTYSYCYDLRRYPIPPPECVLIPSEKQRFMENGRRVKSGSSRSVKDTDRKVKFEGNDGKVKFEGHRRHHKKGRSRVRRAKSSGSQAAM